MLKKVVLSLYISKIPCEIIVLSNNGKLLHKSIIKTNKTKIHVCTRGSNIKLIVKNKGQTHYKNIFLNCARFQRIDVNFVFNRAFSQIMLNIFSLLDSNYRIPITKAELYFYKKSL